MSFERCEPGSRESLGVVVVVISDQATLESDEVGRLSAQLLAHAGHEVLEHSVVPESEDKVALVLQHWMAHEESDLVLVLGGTGSLAGATWAKASKPAGFSSIDWMRPRLDLELPGFAQLFRMVSFEELGGAAMRVGALAGACGQKLVVVLPGSVRAVRLAMERLLLPEMADLLVELRALVAAEEE